MSGPSSSTRTPRSKRGRLAAAQPNPPRVVHANDPKFRGMANENFYRANIWKREIIADRAFSIKEGTYPEFATNIEQRGWQIFCATAGTGFTDLTKEFFANAVRAKNDFVPHNHTSVRGVVINYSADAINRVLQTPYVPHPEKLQFENFKGFAEQNQKAILEKICKPGTEWGTTVHNKPKHLTLGDLLPEARVWANFILSSFMPVKHSSTLATKRVELLFAILTDIQIDVGEIINGCIKEMLAKKRHSLGFPSVIASLCEDAGVDLSVFREPKRNAPEITSALIKDYYAEKKKIPIPDTPTTSAIPKSTIRPPPKKIGDQVQLVADRQDAIHESIIAVFEYVRNGMENQAMRSGYSAESLFDNPEGRTAEELEAIIRRPLPAFAAPSPPPPSESEEEDSSEEEESEEL